VGQSENECQGMQSFLHTLIPLLTEYSKKLAKIPGAHSKSRCNFLKDKLTITIAAPTSGHNGDDGYNSRDVFTKLTSNFFAASKRVY